MSETSTVRGLERGLRVLQALQMRPDSTLHDVHVMTRIPKPSLLRALHTLERFGLITRRLADGRYRIGAMIARISRKPDRYDRVAEVAAPILNRLCARVSWPSDLLVPAGDHMEVRETSRTQTPFAVMFFGVGHKVNWLLSAVGRAYLAYCSPKECQRILASLQKSSAPEYRLARDQERVAGILAETRARGYGIRDPSFTGGMFEGPAISDGLAAIAVPLVGHKTLHGVINMTWLKPAYSVEEFAALHLNDLKDAAAQIVRAMRT